MNRVRYSKEFTPIRVLEYGRNFQTIAAALVDKHGVPLSKECLNKSLALFRKGEATYSMGGEEVSSKVKDFLALLLKEEADDSGSYQLKPAQVAYTKEGLYDAGYLGAYGKNIEKTYTGGFKKRRVFK